MKLFLAAPASFFSAACAAQAEAAPEPFWSASHFFRNEVLAAPASFLLEACASQLASASHFFRKEVLAAPASFFAAAWASQLSAAYAKLVARSAATAAMMNFLI